MKEQWLPKAKCTACGACANICPVQAIKMETDSLGFAYPVVNAKCIDCNKCEEVCDARGNLSGSHFDQPDTYAVWSKNEQTRYHSTSGGVFTELSRTILKHNGCVVGARYRQDHLVEHVMIEDEAGLEKLRQSKYIQSEIGLIFQKIKEELLTGRLVAFCGAPCQVAGLLSFLGKNYENLVTFDFICRGVNSPKAYLSWLDELETKKQSKVARVWFKYKDGGWKSSPKRTRIDFNNGKYMVLDQENNLFMRGYLGPNLYIRPCCGDCDFKGVPRQGDITLADFWGLDPSLDDDKGTSLVLVNNTAGDRLFAETMPQLITHKRAFDEILEGNVCFSDSVHINPDSESFLESLDKQNFSSALKKYDGIPMSKYLKNKIRRWVKKK